MYMIIIIGMNVVDNLEEEIDQRKEVVGDLGRALPGIVPETGWRRP
jgi:hypothetical protein